MSLLRALLACLALSWGLLPRALAADGPSLTRIKATGVIVIGYRPASLPFSYLDAKLKPIGYSIELCDRVIAALNTGLPASGPVADLTGRYLPALLGVQAQLKPILR